MGRRAQGAGSVYLRKDGRAAAQAMYEGKRITKYGKTKKEAWDNLQAALDDLKAGRVVIGPKQTVAQYLTHWLEDEHRLQIGPATLQQYRSVLRAHLIPAFGHMQLSQLKREHVQAFCAAKLDGGLAPRSVSILYAVLSCALTAAVENGILAQNACIAMLRQRAGNGWKELDLVFPNKNGSYLKVDQVEHELRVILAEAGLSERTFHKLRHSAATILFAAGVNAKVVQEMLGHSDISMTLGLYGDVLPDMQQEVADIMDDVFE